MEVWLERVGGRREWREVHFVRSCSGGYWVLVHMVMLVTCCVEDSNASLLVIVEGGQIRNECT